MEEVNIIENYCSTGQNIQHTGNFGISAPSKQIRGSKMSLDKALKNAYFILSLQFSSQISG
jgi:hypothetical protein